MPKLGSAQLGKFQLKLITKKNANALIPKKEHFEGNIYNFLTFILKSILSADYFCNVYLQCIETQSLHLFCPWKKVGHFDKTTDLLHNTVSFDWCLSGLEWILYFEFLSSPIWCVASKRTELLKTEIGVTKMVSIFLSEVFK